ncbi:MAG: KEOPS complex N(6)-L-threonylcarbamoyladenine synthase Kae1 [Candidatus Hodarchaeales archaeon]
MTSSEFFILGIEGTAHTIGVGIVDQDMNILADIRSIFSPVTGGIHPREAATHIMQNFSQSIEKALNQANLSPKEITAIAFSRGPGLSPCLRATATGSRSLALALDSPLISVNHPVAHIELGKMLCEITNPLTLYVSGGNTQLAMYDNSKYHVLGETHDIAIGNLIDSVARAIGYDYALAGPIVEKEALNSEKNMIKLPYSVKGTTVTYSGLMTACIKAYEEGEHPQNICYSLQEYAFAMLVEVTEKALILSQRSDLLLTGGVAANQRLREMCAIMAEENGVSFHVVPKKLAGDNGVMIAITGALYWLHGENGTPILQSHVLPKWRLDEVQIPW